MKKSLVSVIVPIYNVESFLDECMQSIASQTYENLEIILVDDGSPDNCPAMCDAWVEKDSRIKVIHKENGGLSDARNAGIEIATGEWLLFIDSDDVVSIYLVEALVKASTNTDELVTAGIVRFDNELPTDTVCFSTPVNCGKRLVPYRGGMYCFGALYNREIVQSINLRFDPTLRNLEDVVWNGIYLRFISDVKHIANPAYYYYRINPTSITSQCSNSKWQVTSWIAARRSLLNWFEAKPLTQQQKKEARGMFRHCQNNIHAECLAGEIPFAQLKALEEADLQNYACNDTLVFPLERMILKRTPSVYFHAYLTALRLRKFIAKVIKR